MNSTPHPTIGCVVVTLNAKHHLPKCLPPLLNSPLKPRVLVVDSSSSDGTAAMAQALGAETLVIPRADFNHGTTREMARRHLATDIVSMHTQDAYMADAEALGRLVDPLVQGLSAAAYARQVPHHGAGFFEAFPREYNYPAKSHVRSLKDLSKYGVYTFFCSDSCAAYTNAALDAVGGFPRVLLGEDTVAVAKLLRNDYSIAYVAEAIVHHSHHYSLWQEFRRNFDTGIARKGYADLLACDSSDGKRGLDFVRQMNKRLAKEAPQQLPYACAHILAKWSGYHLGKSCLHAPIWLKKALSSQSYYWDNP